MVNSVRVTVKYAGKSFPVELDISSPTDDFKLQIFSLTGVEPNRQKIISKGTQISKLSTFDGLSLKEGQVFTVFGTPSDQATFEASKPNVKFFEELDDADLAKTNAELPSGLTNLGNTCYLNSSLQVLRHIPDFRDGLKAVPSNLGDRSRIEVALRDLYDELDRTTKPFSPFLFLSVFRSVFPQFSETARNGQYLQQDAEECFSQMLARIRETPSLATTIDNCFRGELLCRLTCDDPSSEEPATVTSEPFSKLDCHITAQTNSLQDCIKGSFTEKLEKISPVLGRNASYTKLSEISKLPKYLICHFVRFYWKRDISKKAKILRKVTFPLNLNMKEFCTKDLKVKLCHDSEPVKSGASTDVTGGKEDLDRIHEPSGSYRLKGIVTHQGTSADSGHYCSYVRSEKPNTWLLFNDDKVQEVPEETVATLSGGGEFHSALLLVYEAVEL